MGTESSRSGLILVPLLFVIFLFFLAAVITFGGLIGYLITVADLLALVALIISLIISLGEAREVIAKRISKRSAVLLVFIIAFFLIFSSTFMPKNELVYFDENFYQEIALNIVHSGQALECAYGTAYVKQCYINGLGFDPGGWPFLIAVAFEFFGASNAASHGLELLLGSASILSVFVSAALLTRRREIPVISAAIFSLMPQVLIWSNTVANPDLPFMAFASLSTALFLIFLNKSTKRTLAPFVFCLVITLYLRVEAMLLIPIFFVAFLMLGEAGMVKTFKRRFGLMVSRLSSDRSLLLLLLLFVMLLEPEIFTSLATSGELQSNARFYLYPNSTTFSPSYISQNIGPNLSFLAGLLNDYPIVFLPYVTGLAVIGALFLFLNRKEKNRAGVLLLLGGTFLTFFVFYLFYFSGSVLSGTSVRFLLILYPSMAIFAAFGVSAIADLLYGITHMAGGRKAACAILLAIFFIIPFAYESGTLMHPTYNYYGFPVNRITANLSGVNPYTTQYAKNSDEFINKNYNLVPTNCLVMSELPQVWFMLNRSSAYLSETDIFTNSSYAKYSCYYLDYDFWCTVSPYNTTVCKYYTMNYNLRLVATQNTGRAANFSLYQILNYSPR